MLEYAITFARSARKEMEGLPPRTAARILSAVEGLATNPRPEGCRKLQGSADLWRIRIGDYRVVYSVRDRTRVVDVVTVRHRRDAYR